MNHSIAFPMYSRELLHLGWGVGAVVHGMSDATPHPDVHPDGVLHRRMNIGTMHEHPQQLLRVFMHRATGQWDSSRIRSTGNMAIPSASYPTAILRSHAIPVLRNITPGSQLLSASSG